MRPTKESIIGCLVSIINANKDRLIDVLLDEHYLTKMLTRYFEGYEIKLIRKKDE